MHGDLEPCLAGPPEMFTKQLRRKLQLVTGKIDRHQVVAMREQSVKFAVTGLDIIGPAHDSYHLRANSRVAFCGFDSIRHGFDNTGRIEVMGCTHEPGTETQLDIVNALDFRIFDVFVGNPSAGIQVMKNGRQVTKASDEIHQAGRPPLHHHVRAQ